MTDTFTLTFTLHFMLTFTLTFRLTADSWRLTADSWRLTLTADGWRLTADGWRLTIDGWQLTVDGLKPEKRQKREIIYGLLICFIYTNNKRIIVVVKLLTMKIWGFLTFLHGFYSNQILLHRKKLQPMNQSTLRKDDWMNTMAALSLFDLARWKTQEELWCDALLFSHWITQNTCYGRSVKSFPCLNM